MATMNTFFITGEQRSGTTLLSVLLSRHSQVCLGDEAIGFRLTACAGLLNEVLPYNAHHSVDDILSWLIKIDSNGRLAQFLDVENFANYPDVRSLVAGSVEKVLKANQKTLWGDKVPNMHYYLGDLLTLMPEAKFIHMVRDGRAVASSKLKRTNRSPYVTGQDWVDGNAKGLAHQKIIGKAQYKLVKYEALLREPEDTLKDICDFLAIDYEQVMTQADASTDDPDSYVKSTFDTSRINSFEEELKPSVLKKLEQLQGPMLRHFGYDLVYPLPDKPHKSLSHVRRIWLNFVDNFKALFRRSKSVGMKSRKNVELNVSFYQRLKKLLFYLTAEILSERLYLRVTRRKKIRNVYMDEDLKNKA